RPNSLEPLLPPPFPFCATLTPPITLPLPAFPVILPLNSQNDATGFGSIDREEIDFFRVTARTSGFYSFKTFTDFSDLDTIVAVYDNFGRGIAFNDDISPPPFHNTDSRVDVFLNANQTVFVAVTDFGDSFVGSFGSYRLEVDGPVPIAAPTDDRFENNDTQ